MGRFIVCRIFPAQTTRRTSQHFSPRWNAWTELLEGHASAPLKPRLPLFVPPATQLAAVNCVGRGTMELPGGPYNGGAEGPPFHTPGVKNRIVVGASFTMRYNAAFRSARLVSLGTAGKQHP